MTVLFYWIFKPVNGTVSLFAAFVSIAGCVSGPLNHFHLVPVTVDRLVFFGIYCVLIGYLIYRSTFLPSFLGVVMAIAGLGWLTFLSPSLAKSLSPFIFLPGAVGEASLTLWLLIIGIRPRKGEEKCEATSFRGTPSEVWRQSF